MVTFINGPDDNGQVVSGSFSICNDEDNNEKTQSEEILAAPRCICPSCDKVLPSIRSLFGHCGRAHQTAINQDRIKYMCPFCDASDEIFETIAKLEYHILQYHTACNLVMTLTENLPPTTKKSKKTSSHSFPSTTEAPAELKRSARKINTEASSKQLLCKCPVCDKILPHQGIQGHLVRVHSGQLDGRIAKYICPFCPVDSDRTFRTIELAEAHVSNRHPNCCLIISNSLNSTPKTSPPSIDPDAPMRKSQRRTKRSSMLRPYIDHDLVVASKRQEDRFSVVDRGNVPREEESKPLYKCPDCEKTNLTKQGLHAHYGMKHGGRVDFQRVKMILPKVNKSKKNEVVVNGIGPWSEEEHEAFLEGYRKYGNRWTRISAEFVLTRDAKQVGSHALNYFTAIGEWHNVGMRRPTATPMGQDCDKDQISSNADTGRASDDEENETNSLFSGADDGNSSHCICCFVGGNIVCCSKCPRAYHPKCLTKDRSNGGGVNVDLLPHDWQCHRCRKDVEVIAGEEISQYAFGHKKIRAAYSQFRDCSDYNNCCTLLSSLLDIVKKLVNYDYGYVFAEPVNYKEIPDYLKIVQTPMDYNTVIDRLESGIYADFIPSDDISREKENSTMEAILVHVLCDIERVTHNCQLYNKKDSSIYRIGDVHAKKWSAYFHEYISHKLPDNVERDLNLFRRSCRLERYGESSSKRRLKNERKIGMLSTPSPVTHKLIVTQSGKRKAFVELNEDVDNDKEEEEEDEEDDYEDDEDEECHKLPKKHKQEESRGHSSALIFTENQVRALENVFFSSAAKLKSEIDKFDACSPFSLVEGSPRTNSDESSFSPSAFPGTLPGDLDGVAPANLKSKVLQHVLFCKSSVLSSGSGDTTSLLIPDTLNSGWGALGIPPNPALPKSSSCSTFPDFGVDPVSMDAPKSDEILDQKVLTFTSQQCTMFQQQWYERLNELKKYKVAHGTAVASATTAGKLYHWRLRQRKRYHLTLHHLPHLMRCGHERDEGSDGSMNDDKQWLLTMPEMKGDFALSASNLISNMKNAPKPFTLEEKDVKFDEKTAEFIHDNHVHQLYCPATSDYSLFGLVESPQRHSSRHTNSLFWDECLEELRFFEGEHQRTLVPRDFPHNSYLSIWVEIQRAKYLLQSIGLFSGLTGAQMFILDELGVCDLSSLPTASALLKVDNRIILDGSLARSTPFTGTVIKGCAELTNRDGERKSWSTNLEIFKEWFQNLTSGDQSKAYAVLPRLNWPLYSWCWRQCNASSAILCGTPNIVGVNMSVKKLGTLSSSGFFRAFPYNDRKSGLVCEDDYEGSEAFDSTFELLEEISIKCGTTHIPDWYECDEALRMWVSALERSISSLVKGGPCVLSAWQIEKLIVIGFCRDRDELPNLSSGDVVFLKMLQELKTHLDLFGGCYVSSDFPRLHKWIAEQKELFLQSRQPAGKDVMNSSRLEMLKEAGIDFFTGDCLPGELDSQEFDLLTASPLETYPVHEKLTFLNSVSCDTYWNNEDMLKKFDRQKSVNGNSLILASDDEDLYVWFMEKRGKILLSEIDNFSQGKSSNVLHSHFILKYITTTMNDDGSKGEADEVDLSMFLWLHYYERLLIFKAREGHCKIPNGYRDMNLKRWLSQQHDLLHSYSVNRSIQLRPVQLKLLYAIGVHGSKRDEILPTLNSRVMKRKFPSRKKAKQFYLEVSKK
ncbi:hypothetical protein ACHAXA_007374 [Cyclostephanos tholiformis]|uniref:Uncharacterized protein n=1 Tax=Cyclostephanos tholiformis TaxID=382380 RepID=A0ABD3RRK1_9STRA